MTMTEIRGRVRLELKDKELADAVLSRLAYRVPRIVYVDNNVIECPVCGHEFSSIDDVSNYCPNCGQELNIEE